MRTLSVASLIICLIAILAVPDPGKADGFFFGGGLVETRLTGENSRPEGGEFDYTEPYADSIYYTANLTGITAYLALRDPYGYNLSNHYFTGAQATLGYQVTAHFNLVLDYAIYLSRTGKGTVSYGPVTTGLAQGYKWTFDYTYHVLNQTVQLTAEYEVPHTGLLLIAGLCDRFEQVESEHVWKTYLNGTLEATKRSEKSELGLHQSAIFGLGYLKQFGEQLAVALRVSTDGNPKRNGATLSLNLRRFLSDR